MFMGATEEQMALLSGAGVSHVSYILILYSIAFLLFLFTNVLIHIATTGSGTPAIKLDPETAENGNGAATMGRRRAPDQVARDAEEFELEGLMSEEDSVDSPITPAKRSQRVK
jgi:hypothetical protein